MSRKTNALDALCEQVAEAVATAASDVGGLTQDECDDWYDALGPAVNRGLFQATLVD